MRLSYSYTLSRITYQISNEFKEAIKIISGKSDCIPFVCVRLDGTIKAEKVMPYFVDGINSKGGRTEDDGAQTTSRNFDSFNNSSPKN
jgi:hypothetical protein